MSEHLLPRRQDQPLAVRLTHRIHAPAAHQSGQAAATHLLLRAATHEAVQAVIPEEAATLAAAVTQEEAATPAVPAHLPAADFPAADVPAAADTDKRHLFVQHI